MPQSQRVLAPESILRDAGSTFDTLESPAIQCFKQLKDISREANELYECACKAVERKHEYTDADVQQEVLAHADMVLAKVLDVSVDNKVSETTQFPYGSVMDDSNRARSVNAFVQAMMSAQPDSHTKVLLLRQPRRLGGDDSPALLFIVHLLAICFDMQPADIAYFLPCLQRSPDADAIHHLRSDPDSASAIVKMDIWSNDSKIADLGVRTLSEQNVYIVVMITACALGRNGYFHESLQLEPRALPTATQLRALGPVQAAAEVDRRKQPMGEATTDPFRFMTDSIRTGSWQTVASKMGRRRGHWLGAAIRIATRVHSRAHSSRKQLSKNYISQRLRPVLNQDVRRSHYALASTISLIEALISELDDILYDDFGDDLRKLKLISHDMQALIEYLEGSIAEDRALHTMRMTELQIAESRSAIALTILAFVFVPISLASSVFGMNVQEINEVGHGIWAFIVLAAVLLAMSLVTLMIWRSFRNIRLIYNQMKKRDEAAERADAGSGVVKRTREIWYLIVRPQFHFNGPRDRLRRILDLLGVGDLEKRWDDRREGAFNDWAFS